MSLRDDQTLQQQRAHQAQIDVNAARRYGSDYGSLVRGVPAMIQVNGLGQTLGFLRAKDKYAHNSEHWAVFQQVSSWVLNYLEVDNAANTDLLTWVTTRANSADYRRATAEALAYPIWLKRFAEAEGLTANK